VVEVAMYEPVCTRVELGQQLARQRDELTPLALRLVEPAQNLYSVRTIQVRPSMSSRTTSA
jgi:hypothetical protein